MRIANWLLGFGLAAANPFGRSLSFGAIDQRQQSLQDLVTYDSQSMFIRGERLMLFSGEFHPFRLPVPGLWLDVFQKIKSLGFNGVSFYVDWGLVEGQQGDVRLDGIFDLKPFFDAAAEAGIYLIARPGPYINAETSAGGLPGWTLRIPCVLRSNCTEWEDATKQYLATVGAVIADAQITNGGPVILVQPNNEYSDWPGENKTQFPELLNREWMAFVEQELRSAGVVVPLIVNDNEQGGYWAPGTGLGAADIYGIDAYPMRYDCAQPYVWPTIEFPQNWQINHEWQSPSTPFAVPEFQGGAGTSWGGVSQDMCGILVGADTVRVMYKHVYSFGVRIFNIYMTYGGTNWGNLGYMGGDTSYDYGAAINEYRQVWREKYSEEKLQANFFKVSPAYLTAKPGNSTNGTYANTAAINTTPLFGENGTNFYVVRQANWTSTANVSFKLQLPTSLGNITIPQVGGELTLFGRDSKIVVTDYDIGGPTLIYTSADIFTWAKAESGKTVLIMYGGAGETHEFALRTRTGQHSCGCKSSTKMNQTENLWIVQWSVQPEGEYITFDDGDLEIRLLWRNAVYNYWVLELPAEEPIGNYSSPSKSSVIVNGGYLMRTAAIQGSELWLTGDFNSTTNVELVFEPTGKVNSINVNGKSLQDNCSESMTGVFEYVAPSVDLPDLSQATWKYIDSLPEIQSTYDDSPWTDCNHTTSTNDQVKLMTPTSLFAADYGYHTGSLLYRGHFTANGQESSVFLNVSGGLTFATSVFLNSTFLGSFIGSPSNQTYPLTLPIASGLTSGQPYVLSLLIDDMGQDEEAPGTDVVKFPMGVLNYTLSGHPDQSDISWKMTGNLGGENYADKVRGPRNEGAMYAERQGYHQPNPPSSNWTVASPFSEGLSGPGVGFYTTAFSLDLPDGYDIPMGLAFENNTASTGHYRAQLFVNGYQFGKFIPYFGPEFEFPVPEGILNYSGENTVALTLWALDNGGAKLGALSLKPSMPVMSGLGKPALSPQPSWQLRPGAY